MGYCYGYGVATSSGSSTLRQPMLRVEEEWFRNAADGRLKWWGRRYYLPLVTLLVAPPSNGSCWRFCQWNRFDVSLVGGDVMALLQLQEDPCTCMEACRRLQPAVRFLIYCKCGCYRCQWNVKFSTGTASVGNSGEVLLSTARVLAR